MMSIPLEENDSNKKISNIKFIVQHNSFDEKKRINLTKTINQSSLNLSLHQNNTRQEFTTLTYFGTMSDETTEIYFKIIKKKHSAHHRNYHCYILTAKNQVFIS